MDLESILKDVNSFFKEFEELKNANKDLLEFNALVREELRMARDAERSAESKKARCQGFLLQQQEIIQRLITVKEENENLKCKLKQTESTLFMFQNNSIEEQMRADAKIQEIKEEYFTKLTKLQEDANGQAEKDKSEYVATISAMRTLNSKLEEKLEETNAINASLQEEVETLKVCSDALPKLEENLKEKDVLIASLQGELQSIKAWSDANVDTFHKKLAEQERKHQSELEIWKMAELNRSSFNQVKQNNPVTMYGSGQNYQNQYQPPQTQKQTQGYQQNVRFQEQTSSYEPTSFIKHYKNVLPRQNTNTVRPLCASENFNKSEFVSANDLYLQSHIASSSGEESRNKGEKVMEKKQVMPQKPKILVPNKKRKLFSMNQNML